MNEINGGLEGRQLLRDLFAENRAEWASARFGELFVAPTYLNKLENLRPCFLVGGRGTGKTTSLVSLRFDATAERLRRLGRRSDEQAYFGVLVRMNKNRVRAFRGTAHDEVEWSRLFAHYLNLLVCLELVSLATWLQKREGRQLDREKLTHIATTLGLSAPENTESLQLSLKLALAKLEVHVNNPAPTPNFCLSMAEAPIRAFVEALHESDLINAGMVFCCIDEYENLLDYQQSVVNTYIKHAEPPLSYKVGVRKNGIRSTQTLDASDPLRVPDDYLSIEIADEGFESFAVAVANVRLTAARQAGARVPDTLSAFLEELSIEEEAVLLGAERIAADVGDSMRGSPESLQSFCAALSPHERAFIQYWRESNPGPSIPELVAHWQANPTVWSTRYGNYAYAALFWLSKGNKGVRIRKYYCGERVLLAMAGGNIRYFLELIEGAISQEISLSANESSQFVLSSKAQTLSAREVGFRRINQLDGVTHGVALKRLVLGIGKVFFALARDPTGKTPEVTSFVLSGPVSCRTKVEEYLSEGVGHLAFEASPRTKATSDSELRDQEYRIHPIFSAFFEISHRKKRRATFDASHVLGILGDQPARAITTLLGDAEHVEADELPEQLAFFSAFYGDNQGP